VAVETGGRRGELWDLRWGDIDLPGQTVLFTDTKRKKDGEGPLSSTAGQALARLRMKLETAPQGGRCSARARIITKLEARRARRQTAVQGVAG
jgi:integrase